MITLKSMPSIEVKQDKPIVISVGIVQDPISKKILISRRTKDQHLAGLWEFPGGKLENSESLFHTLKRELFEEVGISLISAYPIKQITHDYTDKSVCLNFWFVTEFTGDAYSKENQELQWVDMDQLHKFEFPEANNSVIESLNLSPFWMITSDCLMINIDEFVASTFNSIKKYQLKQILFRSKKLNDADYYSVYYLLKEQCEKLDCRVIINRKKINTKESSAWHLTSSQLFQQKRRPFKDGWLSCSCHTLSDIKQAERLNVNFILLSAVQKTKSHPEAKALGWSEFKRLANQTVLPVYALGGVNREELTVARYNGAKGVAGISTFKD